MIALLAALLIRTPPPPSIVGLRLDPATRCVEVWRSGELIAEYEPRDGEIYRELLAVLDDRGRPTATRASVHFVTLIGDRSRR